MNASITTKRAIYARKLVRSHAKSCGAPRSVSRQVEKFASEQVQHGSTVWRAYRHAQAWLNQQADATGWWGTPA